MTSTLSESDFSRYGAAPPANNPAPKTLSFGPGQLQIGKVGSLADFACLINSLGIEFSTDTAESVRKLCGGTRTGITTRSAVLNANLDIDALDTEGLFQLSWESAGTAQDVVYKPETGEDFEVHGTLVIEPMSLNADTYGAAMASDVSWTLQSSVDVYKAGQKVYGVNLGPSAGTWIPAPVMASTGTTGTTTTVPVTGPDKAHVKAGDTFAADATITASDAANAGKLAAAGYVADPATKWAAGDKMTVGTFDFDWTGTAWKEGAAT